VSRMRNAVDAVLEASVVGSFTKLGPWVRRRLYHWDAEPVATMQGRTVVISGATSGLGRECARALVRAGASLDIIARNASKAAELCAELQPLASAGASIDVVIADTGDLPAMRAAAATLASRHATIDVLIHNAGALDDTFGLSPDGIEQTLASHVIGPLAMTELLVPQLRAAGTLASPARVLWVSSGGMYVEPLDVATLQMTAANYDGTRAYARAKRAQVTLTEMLAARYHADNIVVHAMHPGWADTPGVARSLPTFRRWVGPMLRDPAAGAETLTWLASSMGEPIQCTGQFWLDRRVRRTHRNSTTRRSDTADERAKLWDYVHALATQS